MGVPVLRATPVGASADDQEKDSPDEAADPDGERRHPSEEVAARARSAEPAQANYQPGNSDPQKDQCLAEPYYRALRLPARRRSEAAAADVLYCWFAKRTGKYEETADFDC